MRAVERAVAADLKALGPTPARSALGKLALNLARRIDARPGDRTIVALSRELRLVLRQLAEGADSDVVSEAERFLAELSTPAFDADH